MTKKTGALALGGNMNELLDYSWNEYLQAVLNNDPEVESIYETYSTVFENFIRQIERQVQ